MKKFFYLLFTSATNLIEAIEMAQDVLCLTLYDLEELEKTIPTPSNIKSFKINENSFVSYVECDTNEYRKLNEKSVKKTLTIPSWLNEEAMKNDLNFSQILKDGIMRELRLN